MHSNQPELRSRASKQLSNRQNSGVIPQKLHHAHHLHQQNNPNHISKKSEVRFHIVLVHLNLICTISHCVAQ